MAIADYSELLVAVGRYYGRDDLVANYPSFVKLAEAKLARHLRTADMEASPTVLTTDAAGSVALPVDYLETRMVVGSDGCKLKGVPFPELTPERLGGSPDQFAIRRRTLYISPAAATTVTLHYYQDIPGLEAQANGQNWLLQMAPDIYLYAVCLEVAIWEKDTNKIGALSEALRISTKDYILADERERWSNMTVMRGGVTP
jgi:hypothetical protein